MHVIHLAQHQGFYHSDSNSHTRSPPLSTGQGLELVAAAVLALQARPTLLREAPERLERLERLRRPHRVHRLHQRHRLRRLHRLRGTDGPAHRDRVLAATLFSVVPDGAPSVTPPPPPHSVPTQ